MTLTNPKSEAILNDKKKPGLLVSIIIPAYNEENNLRDVLIELRKFLKFVKMDHEIIVVNDGSDDKTEEVASKNGATVLSNKTNQGKGVLLSGELNVQLVKSLLQWMRTALMIQKILKNLFFLSRMVPTSQ
jgi:cellulose synthase/poly-beta-1,6-N-acetylglucosamine synthase-like glycosyltransferase